MEEGKYANSEALNRKIEVESKKTAKKFLISEIFRNFAAEDYNYEE